MPDLTNSPLGGDSTGTIGDNYKKAQLPFSRFGTRRLQFYTIEIGGYDAFATGTPDEDNNVYTWEEWFDWWYTLPGNGISTAVIQAVQTVAEIYATYEPDVELDEFDYPYTYFTVAVANSTFVAGDNINFSSHSISLQDAVENSLRDNFSFDYVDAWPTQIYGRQLLQQGLSTNSLVKPGRPQQTAEQKAIGNAMRVARAAARAAAGLPAVAKRIR
jgi:hypothetical protein